MIGTSYLKSNFEIVQKKIHKTNVLRHPFKIFIFFLFHILLKCLVPPNMFYVISCKLLIVVNTNVICLYK